MDISNFLVEVRNSSLERVGVILPEDLRLEAEIPFNSVGVWKVTIREDHPLAGVLAAPGGGLLVTDCLTGETLFSGPTISPEESTTTDDPGGTITVDGITDDTVLHDALAWPQPSNADAQTQAVAYDERTGYAESLMHAYVAANIGPTASDPRRNMRLAMGTDRARGAATTVQARFETLLTLCQNIAKPDNLGFRVVQMGSELRFVTFLPNDAARSVRFSVQNGGLSSSRFVQSAPGATRVIVGGSGGASMRLFMERSNESSLDAEKQWGRRIERYIDNQGSRNALEMQRAADASLAEDGFTGSNARFEPSESLRETFGRDWNLGDRVSLESNGSEYIAPVTALIVKVDNEGLRIGAIIGDATQFSEYAALQQAFIDATKPDGASNDEPHDPTPLDNLALDIDEALAQALATQTYAESKIKTYRQSSMPTGGTYTVGDLWFDTDDGNKMYVWDGSWIDAVSSYLMTPNGRLQVTPSGLYCYDSAGNLTLLVNSANGSISMKGNLSSGSTVSGAIVTGGTIQTTDTPSRGIKISSTGMTAYRSDGAANLVIDSSGNITMRGSLMSGSDISAVNISGSQIASGGTISGNRIVSSSEVQTESLDISLIGGGGTDWSLSGGGLYCYGPGFPVQITDQGHTSFGGSMYNAGTITSPSVVEGSKLSTTSPNTGTAVPNVRINGTGGQLILTDHANSSLRYKENVETLDLSEEQLFGLRPVAYTLKKAPADKPADHVFWGFIAEELQDLGFDTLLEFDEQGRPDEVDYSKITSVLAAASRNLNERVSAQQAEIDALKAEAAERDARMDALEARLSLLEAV